VITPARAKRLSQQLQADRREEQQDLPVDLHASEHLPRAAMKAREHER
jgi:hypothetical protein